jgi:pimeloyl-ACP methyl ester carboxylesterase
MMTSCGAEQVATPASEVDSDRCVVRLHGKGGTAQPSSVVGGVANLFPGGNADGWGGRQWLYFPADRFSEARDIVTTAVEAAGCRRMVVYGFSNGAAFAAKLYCDGETFAGRLIGVVVDDPVPDASSADCEPAPDVGVALYWTAALEQEVPAATSCEPIDWTCEGGSTVAIETYAELLGTPVLPSPFHEHAMFSEAPEIAQWLP